MLSNMCVIRIQLNTHDFVTLSLDAGNFSVCGLQLEKQLDYREALRLYIHNYRLKVIFCSDLNI